MTQQQIEALTYTRTSTTTVRDIYGPVAVTIPEGYEVVGFWSPQAGESYLTRVSHRPETTERNITHPTQPRLILKRVTRRKFLVELEPGQEGDIRRLHLFLNPVESTLLIPRPIHARIRSVTEVTD